MAGWKRKAGRRTRAQRGRCRSRTHLAELADRAALVVTDFFPTFIVPRQIRALRRDVATPVIAVDSATLVPMAYHKKEHGNARGIRTVLMDALPHYLWPVDNPSPRVQRPIDLPFDPVRPDARDDRVAGGAV